MRRSKSSLVQPSPCPADKITGNKGGGSPLAKLLDSLLITQTADTLPCGRCVGVWGRCFGKSTLRAISSSRAVMAFEWGAVDGTSPGVRWGTEAG